MATAKRAAASSEQSDEFIVFPDPPEIPEDKMTNFDNLAANGNVHHCWPFTSAIRKPP